MIGRSGGEQGKLGSKQAEGRLLYDAEFSSKYTLLVVDFLLCMLKWERIGGVRVEGGVEAGSCRPLLNSFGCQSTGS